MPKDTFDYGGPLDEPVKIKHQSGAESFVLRESLPAWEERGWKRQANTDPVENTDQPLSGSLQGQAEAAKADAKASDKKS